MSIDLHASSLSDYVSYFKDKRLLCILDPTNKSCMWANDVIDVKDLSRDDLIAVMEYDIENREDMPHETV